MKNCYLSKERLELVSSFSREVPRFISVDKDSAELFEKLNPVLSDGHRVNIITRLIDKNVPREIADVISQLVVSVPADKSNKGYTDEQISASIVSRHMQNEVEIDMVRNYLDAVGEVFYPDEPKSSEPSSTVAPSEPSSTSSQTQSE